MQITNLSKSVKNCLSFNNRLAAGRKKNLYLSGTLNWQLEGYSSDWLQMVILPLQKGAFQTTCLLYVEVCKQRWTPPQDLIGYLDVAAEPVFVGQGQINPPSNDAEH